MARQESVDDATWDQRILALVEPGVDGTLIEENLRRTPTERLRRMQEMARFLAPFEYRNPDGLAPDAVPLERVSVRYLQEQTRQQS